MELRNLSNQHEAKSSILMDSLETFKKNLSKIADETISKCYSDALPFILDDAQCNARMIAEQDVKYLMSGNIEFMSSKIPWLDHTVALKIYLRFKDQIHDEIIKALQEKIDQYASIINWRN